MRLIGNSTMNKIISEEVSDFYDKYYGLSYIIRYSNVIRIKDESVAEHSFYTALICMKLADYYSFNVAPTVTMALVHDIIEVDVDDITHKTKKMFPKVARAIKDSERFLVDELVYSSPVIGNALNNYMYEEDLFVVEKTIVQLADIIQCSQYANHEIKLGNENMREVYDESIRRRKEIQRILKPQRYKDW